MLRVVFFFMILIHSHIFLKVMNSMIRIFQIIFVFSIFYIGTTHKLSAQNSWSKKLSGVGSLSSPRVADLNRDGIGDVILGVGRLEFQHCDSAVVAFDGKTGEILWKVPADDQIFGSANFMDITGDGIVDVFIGGRSAELLAINGNTGEVIWKFKDPDVSKKRKNMKWFNFYNPQFISDQNNDGIKDILISNGGDVLIAPYDPNRPVGNLSVISSKDGSILAYAPMPDGKETYMSIALNETVDGKDYDVIFGSGGETIGGNLYVTKLSDIMLGDISNAIILDSSPNKGYLGPPAWVDITGDQIRDIIVNSIDGRLLAYDGVTYNKLWQVHMPGTEAYTSVATGYFNADSVPDFFVSYAQGVWPKLDWATQYMINGINGNIEFTDSLGFYSTITPVAADFDQDGLDEALLIVNFQEVDSQFQKYFYNMLVVIDFTNNEVIDLGVVYEGHNLSSTPWIGDMDKDGNLDIVYCHETDLRHTYTFNGMQVIRIDTTVPINKEIKWGAYMGSNYDGVFR